MVVTIGLIFITLCCAAMAIRAARLLHAVLWLAATSVFLAVLLDVLGARQVAVIELSVGAGLVTVLLVLVISSLESGALKPLPVVRWWLALPLVGAVLLLLAGQVLPYAPVVPGPSGGGFGLVLWEQRGADVLLQVALIFTGLLAVLGLLAEPTAEPTAESAAQSAVVLDSESLVQFAQYPDTYTTAQQHSEPAEMELTR